MTTINKVYEENNFYGPENLTEPGKVTVERDAYIASSVDNGLELLNGPWTCKVDGTIASDVQGIVFYNKDEDGNALVTPIKNSTLTIGTEGTIAGDYAAGGAIVSHQAIDIINSGYVSGGSGAGIYLSDFAPSTTKAVSITNNATGSIIGDTDGIYDSDTTHALTVKNAGLISGDVEWVGALTLTNTGEIAGALAALVPHGKFAESITNSGRILLSVELSDGDNTVKNTGQIYGVLDLQDGENTVTNGGTILRVISGADDDTMTNTALIQSTVDLGDGVNKLTNSGSIYGTVDFGAAADTLKNSGTIFGIINMGDGANKLTNSGTIRDQVVAHDGNDVLTNTGTISGKIVLGDGNDTVTGGKGIETVVDGVGNDIYKLGGGDDTLIIVGAAGSDNCDGGAGFDTLNANGAGGAGYVFNLDSKDVIVGVVIGGAFSMLPLGANGAAIIKGFEQLIGSGGADTMIGGAAAETLSGGGGADQIMGGGGADTLRGDDGVDTFFYQQASESGATHATQDKIVLFEGAGTSGGDIIDLKGIDANTKLADNQDFTFVTGGFSLHNTGELRIVIQGADSIIQGDVNGDGKVDFSIDVVGTHALTKDDLLY